MYNDYENNGLNKGTENNSPDLNHDNTYGLLYNVGKSDPQPQRNEFYDELKKETVESGSGGKWKAIVAVVVVLALIAVSVLVLSAVIKRYPKDTSTTSDTMSYMAVIYFDANGGTATFNEKNAVINDTIGTLPSVTRDGCVFDGWYSEREGGFLVSSETKITGSKVTVYAHWTESVTQAAIPETSLFAFTESPTSAEASSIVPPSTTLTMAKTTTKAATTKAPATSTTKTTTKRTTQKTTTTRRVTTTVTTYTLSYSANGGSGAPASQRGSTSYTIPYTKPTKSGYTFLGWSDSSSATSPTCSPGDSVTLYDNVTLYAVWQKITYTLSYDANGGSGAPASQSGKTSYAIPYTEPVRSGYTFLGWSTSSSATSASYHPGATLTINANVTLYAVWQKNKTYTVTFNANGGTCSTSYITVEAGNTAALPTPRKENCNFLGWFTAASGGSKYTNSTAIISDVTLYAHWEPLASALNISFTSSVTRENEDAVVNYNCNISSNYKITDYKLENDHSTSYSHLNPNCSGKYNSHNPRGTWTFRGYPAGTVIKFTVTASDESGKTITKDYYVTL